MIDDDHAARPAQMREKTEEVDADEWREQLLAQCAEAIALLPDRPAADLPGEEIREELPSLYTYFQEVVALRNEVRKGNRRTAETFAKFGEVLEGMREDSGRLRERLGSTAKSGEAVHPPRKQALDLVDLCDRVARLEAVSQACRQHGWLARLRAGDQWQQQAGALSILHDHLQHLLVEAGVHRIDAPPGQAFDPHQMKAVSRQGAAAGDGQTLVVAEELLPGYRLGNYCLRPAEVRLTSKLSHS